MNMSPHAKKIFYKKTQALEKKMILAALKKTGGDQTKAAKSLGITRNTVIYRLKIWGLTERRKKKKKTK
jgi:DNA-binding NtrC family response regulator